MRGDVSGWPVMPLKGIFQNIASLLIGGSLFRRFIVYFLIALSVMLLLVRHMLVGWLLGADDFWARGPAAAVVVLFAAFVALAFASIRAATDVIVRRLAAGVSRLPKKREPGGQR
jgi:hypothetical protein